MGSRKETTVYERSNVIVLRNEGKSIRNISETLKIPKSTVQDIVTRYKKDPQFENAPGRGRKPILTQRDKLYLTRMVRKEPITSASKLAKCMENTTGKAMGRNTISRALKLAGIHSRTPRKKPFISKVNQAKRLAYAKKYVDMPISFWKKIVWSDESKFNVRASDGRKRVWRKDGESLNRKFMQGTVKHGGGSVMIWGSMCYNGVGTMEFVEGIMKKEDYRLILERNLSATTKKYRMGRNFIFMHDNDPKHKSKHVTDYLLQRDLNVLDHPPQSPDLNVIEHLWDEMGRELLGKCIKSRKDLQKEISALWETITPEITKKLVESMPRRLAEVMKHKGGPTSY